MGALVAKLDDKNLRMTLYSSGASYDLATCVFNASIENYCEVEADTEEVLAKETTTYV